MSAILNSKAKLYIALNPEQTEPTAKNYTEICFSDEFLFNTTMNKIDKKYFCNKGETTSIVTGISNEISVSIDYINELPAHKYLLGLLTNLNFMEVNSQFVKVEFPLFEGEATPLSYSGKCCIQFKNNIPSGAADELTKLTFSIFPQDEPWTITPATLITPSTLISTMEKDENAKIPEFKTPENLGEVNE